MEWFRIINYLLDIMECIEPRVLAIMHNSGPRPLQEIRSSYTTHRHYEITLLHDTTITDDQKHN